MTSDDRLKQLDTGEREALLLAESMPADVLLIDETAGRRAAIEREIDIVGTLGVLGVANDIGLINFRQSIERLQTTSMWMSPKLIQNLLDKYDWQRTSTTNNIWSECACWKASNPRHKVVCRLHSQPISPRLKLQWDHWWIWGTNTLRYSSLFAICVAVSFNRNAGTFCDIKAFEAAPER